MTQEEKQLLLQDLCARLPYDVCVHIRYKTGEPCYGKLTSRDIQWFIDSKIENIKPYLRPMSSMTEEEKRVLQSFYPGSFGNQWLDIENETIDIFEYSSTITLYLNDNERIVDWLNKKMFDYRGLIEEGLVIEAPEGMYEK